MDVRVFYWSSMFFALTTAVPAGAQALTNAAAPQNEAEAVNRAALSAAASQTAKIVHDRDAAARDAAAYERAKSDYARTIERYEADRAATARRAADQAEAYRQQMATWAHGSRQRPQAEPVAARRPAKPAPPPHRVCVMERPTGSNVPVKVCRSQ